MVNEKQRIEYAFNLKMFMSDIRLKSGGKSLREIETAIGLSAAMLSRWDNGINFPSLEAFMSICAKLQLEPKNYFDKQVWELKK